MYTVEISPKHTDSKFKIKFDQAYMKSSSTTYQIVDDSISDELKKQLESIGSKPHHNKFQYS